jgi:hypothetical protein
MNPEEYKERFSYRKIEDSKTCATQQDNEIATDQCRFEWEVSIERNVIGR